MSGARVDYPLDALASYHYYRTGEHVQWLVATGRLRIIGDSGAFSAFTQGAPIRLADYAAWARQWDPYLCWTAALDVIGDPVATLNNWRALRDQHGLATVPTLHAGTDPRWLDTYAAEGCDFVGLGGMVGRARECLPWVVQVMRYARDRHPHMRFHSWGVTERRFLDNLPLYSADSSGVGAGMRFAELRLFDPATGKRVEVPQRGNEVYRVGTLLRREYGVEPEAVARSTVANRHLQLQVAARSAQLYARWLQRRHKVTPPAWALHTPAHLTPADLTGPRVHVVAGLVRDLLRTVDCHAPALAARQGVTVD